MSATATRKDSYITPAVILSYPALFEPKTLPNSTKSAYSATLIFPADTPPNVRTEIEQWIEYVGREKFGQKYDMLRQAGALKLPIRTDWQLRNYPENSWYLNAKSESKPGVVGPYPGPDGKPLAITDPSQMYPGAIVRASLGFFGFDVSGNKGVGVGLRNIQKLREGPRLDSRKKAEDEFDAVAEAAWDDALL